MEQYRTEEEQVAALKKWWADNGKSTITGIAFAIAVVFGWKAYQNSVIQTKSAASTLYQSMLESAMNQSPTEETISSAAFVANKLKTEYEGTEYAVFGAMLLAKQAMEKDQFEDAEKELNWAIAHNVAPEVKPILNGRLAKVKAAQGDADGALALLDVKVPASVTPVYEEIKGDILLAKGDRDGAKTAYIAAAKAVQPGSPQRSLLGMKLADLGVRLEDL